jgi:hypothetical protein
MKNQICLCLSVVFLAQLANAQFYPGNIAVLRVGDGVEAPSSSGNAIFIDQYTPAGTLVNSIAIPTNGSSALLISGKATSEGFISLSADNRFLTLAGYNTNLSYTGSLSGAASTDVPRAVATVDSLGNYNFAVSTTTYFSSNNMRSGVTDGTNNYWGAGPTSGTVYLGLKSSAAEVDSTNTEVVGIFNGNLCFCSQKTSPIGVFGFTGMPTNTATPAFVVASSGPSSPSPYAFAISPDGKTLYMADDNTIAKKGGIQKYTNTSGVWSLAYILGTGPSTSGARGLAADFSGAQPIVYATTADAVSNYLIRVVDSGSNSVASVLATAGTNQFFRGVQLAPSNVPAAAILTVLIGTNQFSFNVTGTAGYNYKIETSTNLLNWTPVTTNAAPFVFNAGASSTSGGQFYRARSVP